MSVHCQQCGAKATQEDRFCGSCGHSLIEPEPVDHADGFSPTLASQPPPQPRPVQPQAGDQEPQAQDNKPKERKDSVVRRKSKTMIAGYSAFDQPTAQPPAAKPPAQPPAANPPSPSAHRGAGTNKRTMLGMVGPGSDPVLARPTPVMSEPSARNADMAHGKTMLGLQGAEGLDPALPSGSHAGPAQAPATTAPERPIARATPGQSEDIADPDEPIVLPGRSSLSRRWWTLGAGLVLVGVGVAAWFIAVAPREVTFAASYVWRDDGAKLNLEVDDPNDGLQVAWKEQTVSVRDGRATLNLDQEDIAPGLQKFEIRWRPSNRKTWQKTEVQAQVPFHVFADQERLGRTPPELRVVVRAPKGSKVTLDEREVAASDDRFERVYTLEGPKPTEDRIVHHSRFTVTTPQGETHQGTLAFSAPIAYLQVIQPPEKFVTTKDTVVLRGKVHDGAAVELDGTRLRLRNGLFHSLFRLQSEGSYSPTLTVSQDGFVPRHRRLEIRRVDDLAKAAASFEADTTIDYATLKDRPDAALGAPVAFSGFVYHSSKTEHDTSVQVLLNQCPSGGKCPAWVTYPAAVDVADRTWVEIRGYADGFQKFRTKDDKTDSIPRIRAVFLLPKTSVSPPSSNEPQRKRKRRVKRAPKQAGDVVNPWR